MNRSGNKYRECNMSKTNYTKSECRLFEEIVNNCVEGKLDKAVMMQYPVRDDIVRDNTWLIAILDIAVPELKIGYRVMGEVHGMPFAMKPRDELQLHYLERAGWAIIDIWHSERPDLWK